MAAQQPLQPAARRTAHTLALRNITKRYGAKAVVDNVNLDVGAGKFLTLLGPSGSGKTSILMMIAGFVEPSAGQILLDGADMTAVPPERRNFGMVFQGYALFPHLTVEGNVGFPLAIRHATRAERAAKVSAALDQVRLSGLSARLPRELSGGQQQRVALARALVFAPDILLLDEPLSALDKQLRTDLQAELRDLHRRVGVTFVCVTHDQDEALSMSDEVAVLREGRLIQIGSPRQLFERPATHFVANFLGENNFIDGELLGTTGEVSAFRASGQDFVMRGGQRPPDKGRVLVALRPSKIRISLKPPTGEQNVLTGTISDLSYRGDRVLVSVRTAIGGLKVDELSGRVASLGVDETIWLSWPIDAAIVVEDDRPAKS